MEKFGYITIYHPLQVTLLWNNLRADSWGMTVSKDIFQCCRSRSCCLFFENSKDPLYTNTKSLAKEFSKILIFEYFGYLKTDFDVFLTLIPKNLAWRRVKMQPWGVMGEKLHFRWSRDQCPAKREKRFHFSVGLGFGSGIRAQGLQKWCHVTAHWRVI